MSRVLIIEDDGDLQQLLSITLNRDQHEVHYAFNGREGFDKVLQLQPDLILLDLMMPVLNGVEVLRMLSANTLVKDIPVIVMTAHGDKADQLERSLDGNGVRAYLRKPFDLGEMRKLLRRLIEQYPRHAVPGAEIAKGEVKLDTRYRTVWVQGKLIATLSPARAKLLTVLIESRGPVARARLMHAVWGASGKDASLEKAIQRLREDFGDAAARIQTAEAGYELIG